MSTKIFRVSLHCEERLTAFYKKKIRLSALIDNLETLRKVGKSTTTKDNGEYIVYPGEGIYVVTNGVVTTFISILRLGRDSYASRIYEYLSKNSNK